MKDGILLVILSASVLRCGSILILDRGNPARFIRGVGLTDVNQLGSESQANTNTFSMTQQQAQAMSGRLMEAISDSLGKYNEAMTESMMIEAKEITPLASVNMCRFARTRMSALRVMNNFQALRVQAASMSLDMDRSEEVNNIMTEKLRAGVADAATDLVQMEQDLQQFNEGKLGEAPMMHFGQAMKDLTALQTTLSGLRGVFGAA